MLKIVTIRPFKGRTERNLVGVDDAAVMATALMLLDPFLLRPESWR